MSFSVGTVFRRQNLTSTDGPHAERANTPFMPHNCRFVVDTDSWRPQMIPTTHPLSITLMTMKYFRINHGDQISFFQFEIIINILVSSFCFI